jgi:hypothetical protein
MVMRNRKRNALNTQASFSLLTYPQVTDSDALILWPYV